MDILRDKIVKTRKKHMCNACGRSFEKGTMMRTQVNTFDGIQTWRECPTCQQLLSKYRSHFASYPDDVCHEFCVNEMLEPGQIPEDLLSKLNKNMTEQEAFNDLKMKTIILLSGYVRELGEGKDYETTTYKLSETLEKVFVSQLSELFFKFIDEHYSHSSENYIKELKNSFTEYLKNCEYK